MAHAKVQSNKSAMAGGGSTTIAQAFGSNVTAGNLIVVWVTWTTTETPSPTAPTCADGLGNTYTHLANCLKLDDANDQAVAMFYAKNITGGACTPTVTFSGSPTNRQIHVVEFSGADTAAPLGQSGGQYQASGTARSSGDVTTVTNGELIVSFTQDSSVGGVVITPESTAIDNTGATDGSCGQFEVQTSAGVIAGDFTFAAARTGSTTIATFKVAGGGGGSTQPPRTYYSNRRRRL
jgi:hypothetical protein